MLELQLLDQTASNLQQPAERLSVSPEKLSILSIEETQIEDESVARLSTCCKRTRPLSAAFLIVTYLIRRYSRHASYCTEWRTLGGEQLYPDLASKVAALGHSLIQNHPFVDGNKRVGHGAMEIFLLLNGPETDALVDEQGEDYYRLRVRLRVCHNPATN